MNGGQEFPTSIARNSPKHEFPSGGTDFHHYNNSHLLQSGCYPPGIPSGTPPPPPQHQDLTIDGIPNPPGNGGQGGQGGPFPHRRSRASRTFKNPPQPHMCIREKTIDGKEVFINVLSWTRIANPDNPDAPIPLYGGMKVGKIPPGSPRAPPLVYAVMASPEVLKKAGRKCPDTPERMNLVDLMCEFVEAMNPTLHLSRKPEILKDRDLSGELKDVWSAVQACRDKGRVDSVGPPENLVVYTEFGPETAPSYEQSQHHQQQQQQQHHQQQYHHQQHYPHHQHQQQQHQYGGEPFHHQPQQNHHQQQPQSAITNNSSSSNSCHDINSSDSPDGCGPVPDCAVSDQHQLDELCQEADSLKIAAAAPSKSNGLTLPTTTSPSGSAEATPATSPESNPVPAASTAPQQQGNSSTSPTSPTSTTPVSPTTTTTLPATPQKESKNTSHFFPMFRSSKSSEKSAAANDANGSAVDGTTVASNNAAAAGAQPDTPVKTSSKKSGLNFFRRNKTDSKKAADAPATPTKQKDEKTAAGQLIDKLDESLHLHHHHHHGGSNGTGEIIENSSATIVAK